MPETLEEGLDRSANKRGLTGKERHRYIGGALRNMAKRGAITLRKRQGKSIPKSAVHHAPAPAPAPAPKPAPPVKPEDYLVLEVKQNTAESKRRGKPIYSIYDKKTGKQYGSGLYTKRKSAQDEAKIEMDAHNHPKGQHFRKTLV